MTEKCTLASRDRITAVYNTGHVLVVAEGMKPTPCHTVKFGHSFLPVHPPRLALRSCIAPGKICAQVLTPYRAVGIYFVGPPPAEISVEHAGGTDRVKVTTLPAARAGQGGSLSALSSDTTDTAARTGENPFPWQGLTLTSLLNGKAERADSELRRATGFSDDWDFTEAFRDAVMSLPPEHNPAVDALTVIRVTGIGAMLGGIAGFHRLYVTVEAG